MFAFNESESLSASVRLGFHQNRIAKETGLESLQIFYHEISDSKNRVLSSFNADYQFKKEHYNLSFGAGYGERAPSVSEGYGFFLSNSFDNYDYIENPTLNNEKALEVNVQANYHKGKFHLGLKHPIFISWIIYWNH